MKEPCAWHSLLSAFQISVTSCDSVLYSQITGAGPPTAYRSDQGRLSSERPSLCFPLLTSALSPDEMMGSWEPWEVHAPRSSGHVPSQSSQQWPRSSNATFDAGTEQLQESQPAFGPASHPQPQQLGMSPLLLSGAAEHRDLLQGSCCEDGEDAVSHSAGLPQAPHTQDLTEGCSVPSELGACHLRAVSHLYTGMDWPSCSYCCCPLPSCTDFPLIIKKQLAGRG